MVNEADNNPITGRTVQEVKGTIPEDGHDIKCVSAQRFVECNRNKRPRLRLIGALFSPAFCQINKQRGGENELFKNSIIYAGSICILFQHFKSDR